MTMEHSVKFGFSQTVITPPPQTVFLDGFGERITPAEGIRDDLYVKAFVIRSDSFKYALAVFDACGFEQRIAVGIKRRIAMKNGLSPKNVTICATHTHSAPASGILGDLPVNYFWWDQVGEIAASTVQEAFRKADFCRADFLNAGELCSVKNRRGRESCNKIIKICGFYSDQDRLAGAIVLASCHATCYSGMKITADYPGVLTRNMQEVYPDVPVLFLQGRGADVDPFLPNAFNDEERLAQLGGELSDQVLSVLSKEQRCNRADIDTPRIHTGAFKIPMHPYAAKETLWKTINFFEEKRYGVTDVFSQRQIAREIYWHQKAFYLTAHRGCNENNLFVEMQILKLSESAVFVFLPFEIFSETGGQIEKYCIAHGYHPNAVFIVSHANGTNGYLVPESEFLREDYERYDMEYWYQKTMQTQKCGADALIGGHYEIINAPHWYDLPQCSRESERSVIHNITKLLS
ncbi:MAG: neutral/alkaline non-lysosomal ceramidase N-terminal domain-containing protein [Clostridia bacterium]